MKRMMLVIDEPGSCMECPCREDMMLNRIICRALCKFKFTSLKNERPSYCPLEYLDEKEGECND